MRLLVFAAALVAVPAAAQSASEPTAPVADSVEVALVDPLVVGSWTLDEVEEGGFLGLMGAEIEAMTCDFAADGTARVAMTIVQDQETRETERTFDFETAGGEIVSEGDDPVGYSVRDDGRLELSTGGGLALVLVRAGA